MNARITNQHVLEELREQREEQQSYLTISILTGIGAAVLLAGVTAMMEVLLVEFNAPLGMRIGTYVTMAIFGSTITAYGVAPIMDGNI